MNTVKTSVLDQSLVATSRTLREFGYPDAKPDLIREYYNIWKAGGKREDIIFMFAARSFEDHPELFGEAATPPSGGG